MIACLPQCVRGLASRWGFELVTFVIKDICDHFRERIQKLCADGSVRVSGSMAPSFSDFSGIIALAVDADSAYDTRVGCILLLLVLVSLTVHPASLQVLVPGLGLAARSRWQT